MKNRVRWIRDAEAVGDPDARGFWASAEGRFQISPNYRSTVSPSDYTVEDNVGEFTDQTDERGRRLRRKVSSTFDTVRDCKGWAESRAHRNR